MNNKDGQRMTTERMTYCMGCMKAFPKGKDKRSTCPLCGFSLESYDRAPRCIRLGSILKERYLIGRVLGEGSFGITYIGRDMLLDQIVAIKEYFPINHVSRDMLEEESDTGNTVYVYAGDEDESYKNGLEKFYNEAKILAKFHGIAGVVSVINFFYANGTAYLVMEYVDGITLKEYIKEHGPIAGERVLQMIHPVIKALSAIHKTGIIHRDISPENIMVTADLEVKIIDFGTAKYINNQKSQTLSVVLKPGYAPPEQYSTTSKQGAFTDVYALASTFYYVLTGKKIPAAPDRLVNEDFVPLEDYDFLGEQYAGLTLVLKDALRTSVKKRIQTMEEFASRLKSFHSSITGQKSDSSFVHSEERTVLDEGDGKKRDNKKIESSKKITRIYPYLEGKTDPIYGYRYYIPLNTMVTVGRSKESNIVINMGVIGRKHLEVFYDTDSGLFFLMDNHSVNHTYINNKLCEPEVIYPVKPGSYLRLAGNSCVFQLGVVNEEYRG